MSSPSCASEVDSRCRPESEPGLARSSTTTGPSTYLVDTNVLVYAYDPREQAKHECARELLARLEDLGTGTLSIQVLGEFFRAVTQKISEPLSAEEAERSVRRYARSWPVFGPTMVTVFEAIRGVRMHRLTYYDGLIWATARLNDLPKILSEDFSDGQSIEGVRFLNPFAPQFDVASLA